MQRGGGERVLLAMHRALPAAPIHCAFYWPEQCLPELASADIRPFAIDRVPRLREHHRAALPVLPFAFGHATIDARVVVCGTSGWAAGVSTKGRKVLYHHAVARWIHEPASYLSGRRALTRGLAAGLRPWLTRWDQRAVRSGHRHLVYSASMRRRVSDLYGVDAEVLAPPVTIDPTGERRPVAGAGDDGFLLCPCRVIAYKNIDVVVDALGAMPEHRLVVAGGGPDLDRLRAAAPRNVTFVGPVDDAGMRWLYSHCRAMISAAYEPFGLVTVEAAAFGRPSVVLRAGGFVDTVIDGESGVFFDEPTARAVRAAVAELDAAAFDEGTIRRQAAGYSETAFADRLRTIVAEELEIASGHE